MFLAAEVPDALVGLVLTLLGVFIVAIFSIGVAMLIKLARIEGKLDHGDARMQRIETTQERLQASQERQDRRLERHSRKIEELGGGKSRPDLKPTQ